MSQRKRLANWDDSDDDSGYPSALLEAARRDDWDSPTKASRRVRYQPRPRKPGKYRSQQVPQENQPTVLENEPLEGAEHEAPDVQVDRDPGIGSEIDTATISPEIAPGFSSEVPDNRLDTYVDAVTAHVAGFYHLEGNLFVVQGWDIEKGQSLDHWYHLEYKLLVGEADSNSLLVACTCPSGLDSTCIHGQFFVKYDVSSLLDFGDEHVSEHSLAIMFLQTSLQNDDVTSYFSVRSASTSALKGRAIVRHTGAPGGWSGTWRCSKDTGTATCIHVRRVLLVVGQGEDHGDIGNCGSFAASRPWEIAAAKYHTFQSTFRAGRHSPVTPSIILRLLPFALSQKLLSFSMHNRLARARLDARSTIASGLRSFACARSTLCADFTLIRSNSNRAPNAPPRVAGS
ncbi:hypothetical protein CC1G_15153 [Coprinopsis cinerea okayama7|uniref:Uncharacterized protein n=1 Tax=Coprinopsis cinerea (strain Okayama-7 / 130 / ATCC MYA-4618 / FGSC 9003) TaxID=240176 RepID=D6RPS0_COPC7|nr:hypothetical protein CC1G_15153 [Coprinopsis cinerea okayama7\|eukprot:XP_002910514.1 hypothetical protein CC1G_15153 [Coprinopsis cinerea okayama7\